MLHPVERRFEQHRLALQLRFTFARTRLCQAQLMVLTLEQSDVDVYEKSFSVRAALRDDTTPPIAWQREFKGRSSKTHVVDQRRQATLIQCLLLNRMYVPGRAVNVGKARADGRCPHRHAIHRNEWLVHPENAVANVRHHHAVG